MNIIFKITGLLLVVFMFILSGILANSPITAVFYYKPFIFVLGITTAFLLLSYKKTFRLNDYIKLSGKYFMYAGILSALLGLFYLLFGYNEQISLQNIATGVSTCLLNVIYGMTLSLVCGAIGEKADNG
ncbi:MAG: hypothetical protein JW881_01535 [Spirochaetales bacterium]|nr:hypothetical protein [Spirochaetales bacterium]